VRTFGGPKTLDRAQFGGRRREQSSEATKARQRCAAKIERGLTRRAGTQNDRNQLCVRQHLRPVGRHPFARPFSLGPILNRHGHPLD
jgi:hypothetical protein